MRRVDLLMSRPCTECRGKLQRRSISQQFEREGVKIKLSGIKAWVCKRCGEIYFPPGGADRMAKAANALFQLALAENQHKGTLTARIAYFHLWGALAMPSLGREVPDFV